MKENIGQILKDNLKLKNTQRIGEGDFEEDISHDISGRRSQLALQEMRIKQAFLENQAAEMETKKKLNSTVWEGETGETVETGDVAETSRKNEVMIETSLENLSQQIVESLLCSLSEQGRLQRIEIIK